MGACQLCPVEQRGVRGCRWLAQSPQCRHSSWQTHALHALPHHGSNCRLLLSLVSSLARTCCHVYVLCMCVRCVCVLASLCPSVLLFLQRSIVFLCISRCKGNFHFPCAVAAGCLFLAKEVYCEAHAKQLPGSITDVVSVGSSTIT